MTTDAIGTQKEIAEKIRKGKGDYVLAVKGNQGTIRREMGEYFGDAALKGETEAAGNYTRTAEKARGNMEIREYWQTGDVKWFADRKEWAGLKRFGMSKNTVKKPDGTEESAEERYFISSLAGMYRSLHGLYAAIGQRNQRTGVWMLHFARTQTTR